jgi:hypothetical protein
MSYFFMIFLFFTCPHKREREREIRNSNIHFIRRNPSRLRYLFFCVILTDCATYFFILSLQGKASTLRGKTKILGSQHD